MNKGGSSSSKSFIKVLIDESELERLQQRQLREYSPELSSLSRYQTQMREVMAQSDLSAAEKLSILSGLQGRFDKLKKDVGVLTSISTPASVAASPPLTQQVEDQDQTQDNEEDEKDEKVTPDRPSAFTPFTPTTAAVRSMGVRPQYERKSRNLLMKIRENANIIDINRNDEISVNGELIPGSNFTALFSNMTARNANLNQPGIGQFLSALRQLGVKSEELSGERLRRMFASTSPRGPIQPRLAALRQPTLAIGQWEQQVADEEEEEDEPEAAFETPKRSSLSRTSLSRIPRPALPPAAATSSKRLPAPQQKKKGVSSSGEQSGNGSTPPGTRPKILYVY